MDGDLAPLQQYADLAEEFQVGLIVDEAHADGVFGPGGTGLVHELGLEKRIDVVMGTLGKAMGCAGAAVWAKPTILKWLVNQARPFIYSTAQSPATAGAVIRAIDLIQEESWRQTHVQKLSQQLRNELVGNGFDILASQSQIIPVVTGDSHSALAASSYLMEKGFWVAPIRPPTVPNGSARLRINVTSAHSQDQIDSLIQALIAWRG
jgi:8-amino-7-oxononanoate synthase